jgi:thymidylate synthase
VHIKAATLDDLLDEAFRLLLKTRVHLRATKGENAELSGVVLELTQPRARLSRTEVKGHVFSCLGELLWYLSSSDKLEQIKYYFPRYNQFSEEDGTVWGAYGPRIFGGERSQYEIVRELLIRKPASRQAVIQLYDRNDIEQHHNDVPCTCVLQFLVRDGILNLVSHMRSNDAYLGLPHDIFSFTMLQELMARDLGYKLGSYKHLVGSFHLYDRDREDAQRFLQEGVQATREMPAMPEGRQWGAVAKVLAAEQVLRRDGIAAVDQVLAEARSLDPYWEDVVRLLAIYSLTKGYKKTKEHDDRLRTIAAITRSMSSQFYRGYIRRRARPLESAAQQISLIDIASTVEGDINQ